MAIIFKCRCGRELQADDDAAGSPIFCPKCKQKRTVPFPKGTVEEIIPLAGEEPAMATSASVSAVRDLRPVSKARMVTLCAVAVLLIAGAGFASGWMLAPKPGSDARGDSPKDANATPPHGDLVQRDAPSGTGEDNPDTNIDGPENSSAGANSTPGGNQASDAPPAENELDTFAALASYFSLDQLGESPDDNPNDFEFYYAIWQDPQVLVQLRQLADSENEIIADVAARAHPLFSDAFQKYAAFMNGKESAAARKALNAGDKKTLEQDAFLQKQALLFEVTQRNRWEELMPIALALSAPVTSEAAPLELTLDDRIHLTNNSGQTLSRCTLRIELEDFYGAKLINTYYIDQWEAGAALDSDQGLYAGANTALENMLRVRLSLWSQQASYAERLVEFPEHLRTVALAKMDSAEELMKSHAYAGARVRAEIIQDVVSADDELSRMIQELIDRIDAKAARSAELQQQVLQVAAQFTPNRVFTGSWSYEEHDGNMNLLIEKTLGDGSAISAQLFDPKSPNIRKHAIGTLTANLDEDTLKFEVQADPASGIRGSPRSIPDSRNLLLLGDDRIYTFLWKGTDFQLEEQSGFEFSLRPENELDPTAPAVFALREGLVYEGTIVDGKSTATLRVTITQFDGKDFVATIDYPTLGNARTRVTGTVDGNLLKYTEGTVFSGPVVKGAIYTARVHGPKWTAAWYNQGRTGSVRLVQVVPAPE